MTQDNNMDERGIGWAVEHMHGGSRVRRRGWNGKGMHIALVKFAQLTEPHQSPGIGLAAISDFVAMRTAQGTVVPWLCSQSDLLARDWEPAE